MTRSPRAMDELSLPLVVKIPDGSFSRGIHKVSTADEFRRIADELFEETDLVLAQKFMPTEYDWRVGVLDGEAIFACQYFMAKGHWQIYKHPENQKKERIKTGKIVSVPPHKVPKDVMEAALKAARLIGNGLYGVDLKQTDNGIYVMEINDNPNIDHGAEDVAEGDGLYQVVLQHLITQVEAA